MLISMEVLLRPLTTASYLGNGATAMHGACLRMIELSSPDLARRVHASKEKSGLTVSFPRRVYWDPDESRREFLPRQCYHVRYTSYDHEISTAFRDAYGSFCGSGKLLLPPREDATDYAPTWAVLDMALEPTWTKNEATPLTFKNLWQEATAQKTIVLSFLTPTAIRANEAGVRKKKTYHLLPEPTSIFSQYANCWNKHSSIPIRGIFEACENEVVSVDRYERRIDTVIYRRPGGYDEAVRGFLGICSFRINSNDRDLLRALNALADFAYYCGTGSKTALGMGQTRRIPCALPTDTTPLASDSARNGPDDV